jgi:hypothetical protein
MWGMLLWWARRWRVRLEVVVLGDREEGECVRGKVSGAKRSDCESCVPEGGRIESVQKKGGIDAVLDVVEARGFVMDLDLVGSQVEVVGTTESQRGLSCHEHYCCGTTLLGAGSYVCFRKTRFAWRDGKEENVLEVYFLEEGLQTCKVGYLGKHLAFRADRYDGLCACIVEVYSDDRAVCECVSKRHKYHHNFGCCVATILGMRDMFAVKN